MESFANLSPLNTVVSRKGIWLILWYFSREFDSRVEIVSSFNEPIYFFSVAIPNGENVINATFPFFWFGFALLDYFLIRHENIGKWHCYFHTLSGSMFLEEALLHELKKNYLLGLSQVFPWGSALESVRYDWGTFRMFLILYSFLLLDVYLCITFCGNPNVCKRIVHPLLISHLRRNYNLVNNFCSLNRC